MRCVSGHCECYWAWARAGDRCDELTSEGAWAISSQALTAVSLLVPVIYSAHLVCTRQRACDRCSISLGTPSCVLAASACLLTELLIQTLDTSGVVAMDYETSGIYYTVLVGAGIGTGQISFLLVASAWLEMALTFTAHDTIKRQLDFWRRAVLTYAALYALVTILLVAITFLFPHEAFLAISVLAAICATIVTAAFLGASHKLGGVVATSAAMELGLGTPRGGAVNEDSNDAATEESSGQSSRYSRMSTDGRVKRLSMGVTNEHKRASQGKSHLSVDEIGRLGRMVELLGYIVTTKRHIGFGTALLVVGTVALQVAMAVEQRALYWISAFAIFSGGSGSMTALIHFLHCSRALGKRREAQAVKDAPTVGPGAIVEILPEDVERSL